MGFWQVGADESNRTLVTLLYLCFGERKPIEFL
jgi:hypothetical protein